MKKGFAALYLVMLVLMVMVAIGTSAFLLISSQNRILQSTVKSLQAYYAAEAGIEDALLRLTTGMSFVSPYVFSVENSSVSITIDSVDGGGTVTSKGVYSDLTRKVELVYTSSSEQATFFYGAQVGEGGVELGQNSTIIGNIYSNGSLQGDNGVHITGTVIVAGDGDSDNKIRDIIIDGNAWAPSFEDCSVGGNIVFVTGGMVDDCTAGGTIEEQADPISSAPLPITQSSIDAWKQEAQDSGIISAGDYEPPKDSEEIIGPGVIQGDMILTNNQSLTLAGTVYVQGNIDVDNGTVIRLSSAYGFSSGVLLTDGWVHIKNNGELAGSGEEDSYLMILTTLNCMGNEGGDCTHHDAAMDIHNNATGAIFYAGNGMINLHNNVEISQVTAWKLKLGNGTILTYSLGLANTLFTSGPGGAWQVSSWKEVE